MDMTGQKQAFIRDNALVLYFDNAETPFVARYDLDSLAQANFEVADKKDGFFSLTLRDFAGQTQTVGQFATKADAHQALYAILQALLSHAEQTKTVAVASSCGFLCVIGKILKWLLIVLGVLVMLYWLIGFVPMPVTPPASVVKNEAVVKPAPSVADSQGPEALTELPEGEAVDADAILSNPSTDAPAQ